MLRTNFRCAPISRKCGRLVSMKNLPPALILFTLSVSGYADETIAPFSTDGCSAFPDGTIAQNELWLSCCTAHDIAYWKGGTYEERLTADKALESCVSEIGEPAIGALMHVGVRVGGSPYLPTLFRWGYGWEYPRGYRALNTEEKEIIQIELEKSNNGNTNRTKK